MSNASLSNKQTSHRGSDAAILVDGFVDAPALGVPRSCSCAAARREDLALPLHAEGLL